MKLLKLTFIFIVFTSLGHDVEAQLGKKLRAKLKEAKEDLARDLNVLGNKADKTVDNLKNKQSHYDTTFFNYALSQGDKSSFFKNRDNKQNVFTVASKLGEEAYEGGRSRSQRAFDLNRLASTTLYVDRKAAIKTFTRIFNLYYPGASNKLTDGIHPKVANAVREQRFHGLIKEILMQPDLERNDHYALATTMLNVSLLMHTHGKVRKASKMTNYTMNHVYDKIGKESVIAAAIHNNLAVILKDQGRFIEAEEYYEKAGKTLEAAGQKEMLSYAILLNNMAMLHQATGRYELAISQLKQCIDIADNKLRTKGNDFSKFKINLALIYQSQGQYERSESIYRSLLQHKEKRFGNKHPDYAQIQSSLASLLMLESKTGEVEGLLQNALKIYREKLGATHPAYAVTLTNLGKYYRHVDRLDDAERIFKEVQTLYEQSYGTNHPAYIEIIENIALLRWQQGNITEAKKTYAKAIDLRMKEVNKNFPSLSESEKSKYWATIRPMLLRFYNFAIDNRDKNPELIASMYEIQMATKGLLLSSTVKMKYDILNSGDENLIRQYERWSDAKEDLSRYYTYSQEELKTESINIDSLEQVANIAEKELSKRSFDVNNDKENQFVPYVDLVSKVGKSEAAMEVVRVPKYNKKTFEGGSFYAILIAKQGQTHPDLAIIDKGELMESKYAQLYKNSIKFKLDNNLSYSHYWGSLDEHLDGISKIYLSADGIYNQVNLATLRDSDEKYLGEKFTFVHVSNTNQLLKGGIAELGGFKKAALFGDPDYGSHGVEQLPGTAEEIGSIGGMLKTKRIAVNTYTNQEANESNFKGMTTPGILHVATHGFFVKDDDSNDNQIFGERLSSANTNPMLRSGLILADEKEENRVALDGYADDGIITAYEVLTLDLTRTDMVVLSACETGLGEVKAGEGVYGLQRAFKVAGANTLIMSLWKVNDETTQQLMTSFYKNLLTSSNKVEAFELAQAEIRKTHPEPYYWGAFVMMN